jgi:histidinol phosphatase-like enzyme
VEALSRECEDRKPRPGMAHTAARVLNLDLPSSWVVGDRAEDVGLAFAVGASPIYVGPGRPPDPAALPCRDLTAAASVILERISR